MTAYYNEFDRSAAAWLRELIANGLIAHGEVDERSIEDVHPGDLRGFTQCHFFAGIGGWSRALRMAGWPDNRPVWTGSCPCQPFSAAGKGAGFSDERHLWPDFHWLIGQCEPPVVFGEQVASADGLQWLDLVQADLEATGYAFGAADLCAAGVGAPHIRQRLYWVADANGGQQQGVTVLRGNERNGPDAGWPQGVRGAAACGVAGWLADANGRDTSAERQQRSGEQRQQPEDGGALRLADTEGGRTTAGEQQGQLRELECGGCQESSWRSPLHGHWRAADWLGCRDGKFRPVEPGTFPLAHGLPRGLVRGGDQRLAPNSSAEGRVMRLRGYGNAIVPQVAEAFIRSVM